MFAASMFFQTNVKLFNFVLSNFHEKKISLEPPTLFQSIFHPLVEADETKLILRKFNNYERNSMPLYYNTYIITKKNGNELEIFSYFYSIL